jgi:flagella basal body P-ring formation protein FlgA
MPAPAPSPSADDKPVRTLREILTADLATRLSLGPDTLQISFKSQDEGVLNLSEPMCRFEVEPQRLRNLGDVTWLVLIVAGDHVQKATVTANARAWQEQLVVSRPLGFKQVIRDEDVIKRRTLVDRLSEDPLLAPNEAIGQQAARELKPGTVLTARMVDSVQLCKAGQYITITLTQGTVNIKSVARALEAGSYGQTIRVKNESTKEVFQVILTGPQQATMNLASAPDRPVDLASVGN